MCEIEQIDNLGLDAVEQEYLRILKDSEWRIRPVLRAGGDWHEIGRQQRQKRSCELARRAEGQRFEDRHP